MKLITFFTLLLVVSCSHIKSKDDQLLKWEGWSPEAKKKLTQVIKNQAMTGKVVVFDFDNTIICRDIGEATFAQLLKDKVLTKNNFSSVLTPTFKLGKKSINVQTNKDFYSYYDDYLSATKHHKNENEPYAVGYGWVVQIMKGMSPKTIVKASQKVWNADLAANDRGLKKESKIKISGTNSSVRIPYFYPGMVELIGQFLTKDYKVWILSASNVWTVRWMVLNGLNKKLKEQGFKKLVDPQNVIGISTLLKSPDKQLHKDYLLQKENPSYSNLDLKTLGSYKLTSQIVYPLSGYYGKVANIMKHIGEKPYFVAGDSPNDHPMLNYAQNKLWLARLEKDGYQKKTIEMIDDSWTVQPVLYKKFSGFVPSKSYLENKFKTIPQNIKKSVSTLSLF